MLLLLERDQDALRLAGEGAAARVAFYFVRREALTNPLVT